MMLVEHCSSDQQLTIFLVVTVIVALIAGTIGMTALLLFEKD
jgi:hypothetical protein